MTTVRDLVVVDVPLAATRGRPALTQGTYGTIGNLELVTAGVAGGAWVHWRNSDDADVRPGAIAGQWSAGLLIAPDLAVDDAAILETVHGPRTLEVVLRADGDLWRTTWSPHGGFAPPTLVARGVTGPPALAQDLAVPHDLVIAVPAGDRLRTLRGSVASYPEVAFTDAASLRVSATNVAMVLGVGRPTLALVVAGLARIAGNDIGPAPGGLALIPGRTRGEVFVVTARDHRIELHAGRAEAGFKLVAAAELEVGPVGALTACHANLSDGHRIEVVARIDTALHGFSFAVGALQHPVVSRQLSTCAWVPAATAGRVNRAPEEADGCRS